ncbi:transcriptional regulator [Paenibacillus phage Xenia]|uniref:Transcriptional regulator n=1 Tax=Paenibacillus phage Xenia TaxID=1636263 RepID=A0A0K2CYK8_9CAUD|nr:transcriptional regulator [Paenibacillus phage Xenia]ALA12563.1 transcriptional regulator [Paenibacillus phage Xenia]
MSDEQIKNKFSFTIDGRELSEEEFQRMLAAVRAERLYRKRDPR